MICKSFYLQDNTGIRIHDIHHKPFGLYAITPYCAVDNRIVRLPLGHPNTEDPICFQRPENFYSLLFSLR